MRSHKSLIGKLLTIAFFASGTVHAELQVDLRSGYLSGFPDTSNYQELVRPALDLDGTVYGAFELGKGFGLSFDDHVMSMNGIGSSEIDSTVNTDPSATKKLPASEQNVPSCNYSGIDLSYHGLRLGYHNLLYGGTRRINPEHLADYFGFIDSTNTYEFKYTRKMQHRYEGQYQLDNELFIADAGVYHISTMGEIDSFLNSVEYKNSKSVTTSATRLDLAGGVRIPSARMRVVGGSRALFDHARPSMFNSLDLFALVGGDAALDFHRLEYYLRTGYFSQKYLEDTLRKAHATTGFFQTLYLRGTFWIGQSLMIKGLSVVTFARDIVKQRYGLSLRKPWENGSFLEAGGATTIGGFFPMVDYFIQSGIRPIEPLGLSFRLKSVWDWPRQDEGEGMEYYKTLFVKAIWEGEASYRLGSTSEFYVNGEYTDFNSRYYNKFTSRLFMGGGFRFYLP